MKKTIRYAVIIFFFLVFAKVNAQSDAVVNPNGNWFFGAEIGTNTIAAYNRDQFKNSVQGGFLAEYYFGKQWSVSGRIKYFKTGITLSDESDSGYFEGAVLAVPINLKWEFRLYRNLHFNLKTGFALNQEIKSDYHYPISEPTDYNTFYVNFNPGFGLNYYLNSKTSLYLDYEVYVLGNDRDEDDFLELVPTAPVNVLLNFGVKYSF